MRGAPASQRLLALGLSLLCLLPVPMDVAAVDVGVRAHHESLQQRGRHDVSAAARRGRDGVLPGALAAHGAAASFSDAATAFSGDSKKNKTSAVSQCVRMVEAELRAIAAADDGDDFDLPRLEIWCTVTNVRVAKQQLEKQPARAVLFNETKKLWKKACKEASTRTAKLLSPGGDEASEAADAEPRQRPFPTTFYCEALHDAFFRISYDDVFPTLVGTYSDTHLPPLATGAAALDFLKIPRPCCEPHMSKGCHDQAISTCVCAKDASCCNDQWDLRCAELVEQLYTKDDMNQWLQCGRCPPPASWDKL